MLLLHERAPGVEVAQMVGWVRTTVYRTVYRFEALDEASLVDRRTTGGAEKVTTQMEEQLLSYLARGFGCRCSGVARYWKR